MFLSGLELSQVASHFSGDVVLNGGARLQRIVLGDEDLITLKLAAVDFQNPVLENISIVVNIVGGESAWNLGQAGGNLGASESRYLAVHACVTFAARDPAAGEDKTRNNDRGTRLFDHYLTTAL